MTFTRELWLAGSRRGYYADIDNSSSSSSSSSSDDDEDDYDVSCTGGSSSYYCCVSSSETTATTAAAEEASSGFYKDIQPRHRRRRRRRLQGHNRRSPHGRKKIIRPTPPPQNVIHPDIDLSLVSLLTSKEHDRRQFKKLQKALNLRNNRGGNLTLLPERGRNASSSSHQDNKNAIEDESYSSSSSSPSSSSSSESDNRYCNNIIKTEHEYSKALLSSPPPNRPIAVIDYGSVQFGQLGSVLDSIYKIGSDDNKNKSRNRRRFSIGGDTTSSFLVDGSSSNDIVVTSSSSTTSNNFSTTQPALTVASSRSSDVAAVIASLKNPSTDTMKRKANCEEDRSSVKKKIKFLPTPAAAVHKTTVAATTTTTTTLEDAVAFSPYARVLFTADLPQTVVHINAAYGALVKKGLANPCALGRPLKTTNSGGTDSSFILDEETVSKIVTDHLGISTTDINYQVFPIISAGNESFCDYTRMTHRSYELGSTATEEGKDDNHAPHRHVSHYLLQIEPVAQLSESRL